MILSDRHSLQQIDAIERMVSDGVDLKVNEALFVATQLVMHGSKWALRYVQHVSDQVKHPNAQQYLVRLRKQATFVRGICDLDEIGKDQALKSELYRESGICFMRGDRHRQKLLVVFTTMYNNFFFSNLVLYALLRNFSVSILLLKDTSLQNYLNGVVGFGNDIAQVSQNVKSLARREGVSEIYITGFSSGGYASLFSSCLLPCTRYLGFSVMSDLSKNSTISPAKFFTDEVRAGIDQKWLTNLRDIMLKQGRPPRRDIFFGRDYKVDAEQAKNLDGVPETRIIGLDCGHLTIASLVESGRLTSTFRSLLFTSEDMIGDLSEG